MIADVFSHEKMAQGCNYNLTEVADRRNAPTVGCLSPVDHLKASVSGPTCNVSHWPGRVTLIFTWLVDVDADPEADTDEYQKEKTELLVGRRP